MRNRRWGGVGNVRDGIFLVWDHDSREKIGDCGIYRNDFLRGQKKGPGFSSWIWELNSVNSLSFLLACLVAKFGCVMNWSVTVQDFHDLPRVWTFRRIQCLHSLNGPGSLLMHYMGLQSLQRFAQFN